ncbi:MAG TPA: LLM class F420-dependent oxidoreductase [Streptosporangiaceae bacterium]|nr:LLM class F420-dependent oxidoreductase [Streptosporangiaceae bacterium]
MSDATGARWGITVPFDAPLHDHRRWFELLEELGYTDAWSGEADGLDGFSSLLLAAAWTSSLRVGPAVIPAYTRGPALIAQSAAALAEAAPGRSALGIGTSSDVIVEAWNGIPFTDPYHRVRDTLRFLRDALAGQRVDRDYGTFAVHGFRLARPVPDPPPLYLAALRSGMLRLAGREADGVIVNWLAADDVPTVVAEMRAGAGAQACQRTVAARVFVCPSEDAAAVRAVGRRAIAAYLNVTVYAEFHRWLGRAPVLQGMWDAWRAGDRKAALDAIPDELVDQLIVHGPAQACREHIRRYVRAGVDVPIIALIGPYGDLSAAIRGLAPGQ